jgi:hypothetical protein
MAEIVDTNEVKKYNYTPMYIIAIILFISLFPIARQSVKDRNVKMFQ